MIPLQSPYMIACNPHYLYITEYVTDDNLKVTLFGVKS